MKVTRGTLHEMIDKVNESELHEIYDVLQSILTNFPKEFSFLKRVKGVAQR
ncbi:hypothetical protein P4V05_10555 [Bacillus thuringiensis]|nr:hypothetical protein [Bacillus thuringiensis]